MQSNQLTPAVPTDSKKPRQDRKDPLIDHTFFNKYVLKKKLGEGSFGKIYQGDYNNEKFALKLENRQRGQSLLEAEAYIMNYLKGPGIPNIISYSTSGEFNILVMELLGKSLEDILNSVQSKTFSIQSTCNLAVQMLVILEDIHEKHIIHRDIKPDNFVMGSDDKSNVVYLLDFGLAKKYRSSRTLQHSPMIKNRKLTGTARYASINALVGIEQSRRDDLESLGYVLMYFLRGSLPWQGLPVRNHEDRYMKIMEKKRDTTPYELCKNFPKQFETFVTYTRNLGYEEDPKYEWMKGLFEEVVKELGYNGIDRTFDWIKPPTQSMTSHVEDGKQKITVINNYYNSVNNIVINGTNEEGGNKQQGKQVTEDVLKGASTPKNSQCEISNLHSGKNVLLVSSGNPEPSTRNSNVCVNGNDGGFVNSVNADANNATFIINREEMPKEEFDIEIKNESMVQRCQNCQCVMF